MSIGGIYGEGLEKVYRDYEGRKVKDVRLKNRDRRSTE